MPAAARAGVAYFAIVFALGFALGTLRVTVLIPRLGELGGVSIELPVMIAASFAICGALIKRFTVSAAYEARLVMGVVAFALLMIAEFAVSTFIFQRGANEFVANLTTLAGALGLAGQILFALMPLLRKAS
ncbi:MAG: hypothetical protein HY243_13150 [Proteobacteria bacterium]|nr:hypothetical protein [Pseudomonadota bacterium]